MDTLEQKLKALNLQTVGDALSEVKSLHHQLAECERERDELADAFTVLWVSQDKHERNLWDQRAVAKFDALLAKLGADKMGEV